MYTTPLLRPAPLLCVFNEGAIYRTAECGHGTHSDPLSLLMGNSEALSKFLSLLMGLPACLPA